jgi:serine phosphatase RsbU (regulator of sigma subunit)
MTSLRILRYNFLFLLLSAFLNSRAGKDSLLIALSSAKDTTRVKILLKLSALDRYANNVDAAAKKIEEAKKISAEEGDSLWMGKCALEESSLLYHLGSFKQALRVCNHLIPVAQRNKYTILESELLLTKGQCLGRLGDFKGALDSYHSILPYYEKNPNINMLFRLYSCIAGVYYDQLDYNMAIEYFKKALDHSIKAGHKNYIAQCYNNIGSALGNMGKNSESKQYYLKAVPINIEIKNAWSLAYNYMNISWCELAEKDLPDAAEHNRMAKELIKEFKEPYTMADVLAQEAEILMAIGKKTEALRSMEESLALAEQTKSPVQLEKIYKHMASILESIGDYRRALQFTNKFIRTKDSIINENIREEVTKKKLAYEFEKEQLADSLESASKQKHLSDQLDSSHRQAAMQRNISIISVSSLLIMAVLSFFLYRGVKRNKAASKIIVQQKKEVEIKNKEITDSMHYAKKIQNTLMAQQGIINSCFPHNFILFKPKDIVSGDFYWAAEKNDHFFLAVCDSTGHGVPGAFMSLLNMGFLTEAVKEKNITQPNEIFNYIRQKLIESFSMEGQKDGMDGIIIWVDLKTKQMTYAAANNPPVLIRNGRIGELAYDKMPVGRGERTDSFRLHELNLQAGDSLYLYTDGYADQFGGVRGKKYMYKKLNQKLLSIRSLDVQNQREDLSNEFDHWKGALEQVDDVCIIGIRV